MFFIICFDADAYNLSMGILLDDNLIWTGWSDFTGANAVTNPTADADLPLLTINTPVATREVFQVFMTQVSNLIFLFIFIIVIIPYFRSI